ncbi:unnamed protein product, partial [Rotaria sp. Silwood1]
DKTISFYEHIYKSYLSQENFSMSNYMRDLIRVVLYSSDALQTDIQRIQVLQKEYEQVKCMRNIFFYGLGEMYKHCILTLFAKIKLFLE